MMNRLSLFALFTGAVLMAPVSSLAGEPIGCPCFTAEEIRALADSCEDVFCQGSGDFLAVFNCIGNPYDAATVYEPDAPTPVSRFCESPTTGEDQPITLEQHRQCFDILSTETPCFFPPTTTSSTTTTTTTTTTTPVGKVTICHFPPGNPANYRTLTVDADALFDHLAHGDSLGPCD